MTTDIQAMRVKMCELSRLLYKRKLTDAAYIFLQKQYFVRCRARSDRLGRAVCLIKGRN
jgi:hypothetical protein